MWRINRWRHLSNRTRAVDCVFCIWLVLTFQAFIHQHVQETWAWLPSMCSQTQSCPVEVDSGFRTCEHISKYSVKIILRGLWFQKRSMVPKCLLRAAESFRSASRAKLAVFVLMQRVDRPERRHINGKVCFWAHSSVCCSSDSPVCDGVWVNSRWICRKLSCRLTAARWRHERRRAAHTSKNIWPSSLADVHLSQASDWSIWRVKDDSIFTSSGSSGTLKHHPVGFRMMSISERFWVVRSRGCKS